MEEKDLKDCGWEVLPSGELRVRRAQHLHAIPIEKKRRRGKQLNLRSE